MSDQEINIAIAEACGWTNVAHDTVFSGRKIGRGIFGNSPFGGEYRLIPDYCGDLNAMHEAEKILSSKHNPCRGGSQLSSFIGWLGFCGENNTTEVFQCVHATSRQRAEAFLLTIGKWKEAAK